MEVGNSRSTHFLWTRWHALGNTIQRKLKICVLNIGNNAKSVAANLSTNKRCWYTTKAFVNCDSYSTLSIWSRQTPFQQPFRIIPYMIYSKYRCARTLCPCSTKHHPCLLLLLCLGTRSHPRELHFVSCACDGCFPAATSCCLMVVTAAAASVVVKRAFGCINEHAFVAVLCSSTKSSLLLLLLLSVLLLPLGNSRVLWLSLGATRESCLLQGKTVVLY